MCGEENVAERVRTEINNKTLIRCEKNKYWGDSSHFDETNKSSNINKHLDVETLLCLNVCRGNKRYGVVGVQEKNVYGEERKKWAQLNERKLRRTGSLCKIELWLNRKRW